MVLAYTVVVPSSIRLRLSTASWLRLSKLAASDSLAPPGPEWGGEGRAMLCPTVPYPLILLPTLRSDTTLRPERSTLQAPEYNTHSASPLRRAAGPRAREAQ